MRTFEHNTRLGLGRVSVSVRINPTKKDSIVISSLSQEAQLGPSVIKVDRQRPFL